jgi:uncharacterized membrane protein YdjX (TVP38/TMEM64 family)
MRSRIRTTNRPRMPLLDWFAERLAALDAVGWWAAPLFFIAAYVAASIAFVPGSLLTLAAGAVFGLYRGVPLVFISAVLGSSAAFGISRTIARDRVTRWLARTPRAAAVADAVADRGLAIVFLLRLSPVVPYNALNYALGASRVRYRDFLLASVGMLPGTVLYTYYGKVIGDVAALAAGAAPPRGPGYYALTTAGLLATVGATLLITRAARRRLSSSSAGGATGGEDAPPLRDR